MGVRLDLRLPRDASSVPVIRRLVDGSLRVLGVDRSTRGDIELMLTEACSNVVRHAGAGDHYRVSASVEDDSCVVCVSDMGRGFDSTAVGTAAANTDEHGRGMQIMRALADEVRFTTVPGNGALVSLAKSLQYAADAPGRRLLGAR